MIRIHKDLTAVPASLASSTTATPTTTQKHWDTVITNAAWADSTRYKEDDTKAELKRIYNNKCAFCEKSQMDSFSQVEHFRPKSIYYWLGFSWDNLLLACPQCNTKKSDNFEILGSRATYSGEPFTAIHGLSAAYDISEQPQFFNPENADPEPDLTFDNGGGISSANLQLAYTITNCGLDRKALRDLRMQVFNDELKKPLATKLQRFNFLASDWKLKIGVLQHDIFDIIEPFCQKIIANNTFIAWRKYIIRHCATFLDFGNPRFNALICLVVEEKIRRNADFATIFI